MEISEFEKRAREIQVRVAMGMNTLGADPLTESEKALFQRYVNGEIEYQELIELAISGDFQG